MILKIKEYGFKINIVDKYEIKLGEEIYLKRLGENPEIKIIPTKISEDSLEFNVEGEKKLLNKYNFIQRGKNSFSKQNLTREGELVKGEVYILEKGEEICFAEKSPKQQVFDAVHGYIVSLENE